MGNKTVTPAPPTTDFYEPTREKETISPSTSLARSNSISIPSSTRRDTYVTPINPTTILPISNESRVSSGLDIPMTTSEILPAPASPDSTAVSPTIPVALLPTKSPTFISTSKLPLNETQTKTPSRISMSRRTTNLSNKTRIDEDFTGPATTIDTRTSLTNPTTRSGPTKQWYRKTPVEEKVLTPERETSSIIQEMKSIDMSRQTSIVTIKQPEMPTTREIVAVPSYQLRSTAVILRPLERTQSMYSTNSTVRLSLSQRMSNLQVVVDDQSKSTMEKTKPMSNASVLFLAKDFHDGTLVRESPLTPTPTFAALGLNEDLETDFPDQSILARVHEKQLISESANLINYGGPDNYKSINSSFNERTAAPPRPLPSILKKSSFQQPRNQFFSLDESRKLSSEKKHEAETNGSVVSFNLPPPTGKATQSISRSENLFSRSRPMIRGIS